MNLGKLSKDFLEISGKQRLEIIMRLLNNNVKISQIARELNTSMPEVFRNFERLVKAQIIKKNNDGSYSLTTYGKVVCNQVPSFAFLSENRIYFTSHYFGDIPKKYISRIGQLENCQKIRGFTKVMEIWKSIISNAQEYIYGILLEEPLEFLEPVANKAKTGVKVCSIFSESTIIPKGRKNLIEKLGFDKITQKGLVERKMRDNIQTSVFLNESQACVMFPSLNGEFDMSTAFFSKDDSFREWCLDYFRYCWYGSDVFKEHKLSE